MVIAVSIDPSPGTATPSRALPAAFANAAATTEFPSVVDGFAPEVDVAVRVACGPAVGVLHADAAGTVQLSSGKFADLVPGRYKVIIVGPPAPTTVSAGTVTVTVPRAEMFGVAVDDGGIVTRDDTVPSPSC